MNISRFYKNDRINSIPLNGKLQSISQRKIRNQEQQLYQKSLRDKFQSQNRVLAK